MRRNPYVIGLLAAGGIALVIAFMIWNALVELTDYSDYDIAAAAGLSAATQLLTISAVVAFTGAAVISGVAWANARAGATAHEAVGEAEPAEAS